MKIISQQKEFQKRLIADVNEELSILIRRVQLNFGLTYEEAFRSVTISLKNIYPKKDMFE